MVRATQRREGIAGFKCVVRRLVGIQTRDVQVQDVLN